MPIKAREVKPPEFPLISSRMRETHRRGERGEDEDCFCGLRTYSASWIRESFPQVANVFGLVAKENEAKFRSYFLECDQGAVVDVAATAP